MRYITYVLILGICFSSQAISQDSGKRYLSQDTLINRIDDILKGSSSKSPTDLEEDPLESYVYLIKTGTRGILFRADEEVTLKSNLFYQIVLEISNVENFGVSLGGGFLLVSSKESVIVGNFSYSDDDGALFVPSSDRRLTFQAGSTERLKLFCHPEAEHIKGEFEALEVMQPNYGWLLPVEFEEIEASPNG